MAVGFDLWVDLDDLAGLVGQEGAADDPHLGLGVVFLFAVSTKG